MAPTELLADQHFGTFSALLEPLGLRVVQLKSSMTAKAKRETLEQLALGEVDLAVGTHALISEGVEFPRLALAVTDEQHRFGVGQRSALAAKTSAPHVLVMSATPIPRTLALILYGDLDVSIIDELPPGRQRWILMPLMRACAPGSSALLPVWWRKGVRSMWSVR